MDRYDILEFSKVYKRVMDVEIALKQKMLFALTKTYPGGEFSRLIPYLQKQLPYNKYIQKGRNRISDIISSKKTQHEKLVDFLNIAYLIDVLNILTEYNKIRKDKYFKSNFYTYPVDLNTIKQHISSLNSLRNAIMHFDIFTYTNKKGMWLPALSFWEVLLESPNMHPIHCISPIKNLNIQTVLSLLADHYPDLYQLSDRLVCEMFDDAALINGGDIRTLPQYWSIIRVLYELKRQYKKDKLFYN